MRHLAYKKTGKGFPIVLIHGYLGGPLMWHFQVEELQKHYEVITPYDSRFIRIVKSKFIK